MIKEKIISLKNNLEFMKYFKNTSWLMWEQVLRIIVGLFIWVWITRYLWPEQFGIFSYAWAFVWLFASFATLWLDQIVIRELVKDESKRDKLLGTAFYLKLIGAFIVLWILAIATSFSWNDTLTNTIILIIASTTIFQSFNVINFYFQSRVLSKFVVYANIISLLISSILKILLILNNFPLIAFAYVVLFDSIVLAWWFVYFYIKNKQSIWKWRFDKKTAISLLKDSWPLILSGIVISIYMKIDQVMIKEMLWNESVWQYSAAVTLSTAFYFIPMIITSSLFPAIVKAKEISEKLYYSQLQKLYNLMVILSLSIAIPMTFMSDWIVNLLYGNAFNEAWPVLMIHIWALVFVSLWIASWKWFITENLQMLSFLRTFYWMIINITLNIILIPKYWIQWAAIATLISQITATYIFDLFNIKTRLVFYMKTKSFLIFNLNKKWQIK